MAGDFRRAAQKAIGGLAGHGGKRDGAGRKKRFVRAEVEEELWLTLDSFAARRSYSLDGAASYLLNQALKLIRGKAATEASRQYWQDQANQQVTLPETAQPKFRLRKRHNYPLPKKTTAEPVKEETDPWKW